MALCEMLGGGGSNRSQKGFKSLTEGFKGLWKDAVWF